jgi:glycine oxidase
VRVPGGEIEAGQVVIAGGAWSDAIGQMLGTTLPVFPVRGQIVSLGPCLPPPLKHTVYAHCGYLVPKADGRILVGATQENAGFDIRPTCDGIGGLLGIAPKLLPALSAIPVESTWAGLRPGTPDQYPILGRLPNWKNVFAATGHFRNGILLAPITSQIMADMLLRDGVDALASEFAPERFDGYSGPLSFEGAH